MVLTLFATSPLAAQADKAIDINLQVLAWNGNVNAMVAQADEDPVSISANRKRVSLIYKIKTTSPLMLHHPSKDGSSLGAPMASVVLNPNMRDVLLLLSEKKGRYQAALLPFAQKDFPKNTVTIMNLTDFPVMAQIEGERQMIDAKARHQVAYQYGYADKESLRTKFAVEHNGRMRLVQNGFVPLINEGRVLFFISEKNVSSDRPKRSPVEFTYAYDIMPDPNQLPVSDDEEKEIEAMMNELQP
jgi:hypothetical protein